ncbi:MAG: hypothetical protein KGL74_10295 [Elusimicrobia bacterium]|nr:hypothetical protein [Elusimicrobiota bacterium]
MADDPQRPPDDIQGILSDLDDILSDISGSAGSGDAAVEPPKPVEAVKPPPPPPAPPPPAPAPADDLKIELAPRAGSLPAPKKIETPKPVDPPKPMASDSKPPLEIPMGVASPPPAAPASKPVEAPKPVEPPKAAPPPAPAPAAAPAPVANLEDIPAGAAKDQIRRVAFVHTFACAEARAAFAAFLSQAARTISKKPLYLRQVLSLEVDGVSDPNAIFEKARAAKAVAVLAVVEGWPSAKVDALEEACSRGGLQFRAVSPGDVQKKSTAVDVIVDMMLLPGEA